MPVVILNQQNTHTGVWQKLAGKDANSDFQTGPMSDCVSAVYIGGADVRGYHGGGGMGNINFGDLKRTIPDSPHTKIIIAMGSHYRNQNEIDGVIRNALCTIKYYGFRNLQWEFYQPPGGNAIIHRTGAVTDSSTKQRLQCLKVFISMFARGLEKITHEEAMPYHEWADFQRLKKRPLPPIPR